MDEYIEREAAEKVAEKYGCTNGSALGIHQRPSRLHFA